MSGLANIVRKLYAWEHRFSRDKSPMLRQDSIDLNGEPVNRRYFLGKMAAGYALVSSLLTIDCGGDTSANPYVPPDTTTPPTPKPVFAEISGDTELAIPELGGVVSGNYSSADSTGPITSRIWTATKDVDPFNERRVEDLGGEVSAQTYFARPGIYTIEVEVKGKSVPSSKKEMQTTVGAPELPGRDYPLMAFIGYEDTASGGQHTLLISTPPRGSNVRRIAGNSVLFGQTLTLERTGERLATDAGSSSLSVIVYNLLTDELVAMRGGGGGLWKPAWNPRKDWIAAIEFGGRGDFSEPILIRPDGSDFIYVAGSSPNPEVAGSYVSWFPDGERFMMADANFDITDRLQEHGSPDKRAAIYEGFWDGGTPTRTQMPTEEQLMNFLESQNGRTHVNIDTLRIGIRGVAVSPDGAEAVYSIDYGLGATNSCTFMVKSQLNGQGDIKILASKTTLDSLFSPTWSPNGEDIFFTGQPPGEEHRRAYRIPSSGGSPSQITSPALGVGSVSWYL